MLKARGIEDWEDWLHVAVIEWLSSGKTEHSCLKAWLVRVALNKRTDDYRSLRSRKTKRSIDSGHCDELIANDTEKIDLGPEAEEAMNKISKYLKP